MAEESEVPYSDLDTGKWTVKMLKQFVKDHHLFKGYSKMKKADLLVMIALARSGQLPDAVKFKGKRKPKKKTVLDSVVAGNVSEDVRQALDDHVGA